MEKWCQQLLAFSQHDVGYAILTWCFVGLGPPDAVLDLVRCGDGESKWRWMQGIIIWPVLESQRAWWEEELCKEGSFVSIGV